MGGVDKRTGQGRVEYEGKRTSSPIPNGAQQSFVSIADKRNKRDVWDGDEQIVNIRFGGSKYGDNDDPHFATKSGKEWHPQVKHKNLQENGQQNHSMHERRADGLPDETYIVRNKRDVWSVSTQAVKEAHFATFPEKLIEPCILAGSKVGGVILDPFFGSGTTGRVATKYNREYIGIELNPEYVEISNKRTDNVQMDIMGFLQGGR